jgi:hypothetical protein
MDYNVWTGGTGRVFLDKSTDGGKTWGKDKLVTTINLPPLTLNGGTDARAKGAPVLEVSPTNPLELYLVYAADPDGALSDEADIFFIKSTDGGNSWGAPNRVNDDSTKNDQFLPWVDVKADGTIDIAWYDRRNDAFDLKWDVYFSKSTDKGATFSTNVLLNDASFVSPNFPTGGKWMGEYLGLAVDSGYAFVVWTSTVTDNNGDVYFDKVPNKSSLTVVIHFEPKVLKFKSLGRWINCRIELPAGYDASDVDITTVKISDINGKQVNIPALNHPVSQGSNFMMVKFDRSAVKANANPGLVGIGVTGGFNDGVTFGGYAAEMVLHR